jgi:pilus assembly protein CpaC
MRSNLEHFFGIRKFVVSVLLFCALAGSVCAEDLIILKGSNIRVPIEGVRKVTVANPAIIDARPDSDGQSVLVSGLSEGNSELRIERLQGAEWVTNVVVRSDLTQMYNQIKELLSDVEGLEIKIVGNKIVLNGKILTKSDNDKVERVIGAYNGVILNMSTFDTSGMSHAYEQAILQEIGLDSITARVVGDTVILEGAVYSEADSKRAETIAHLKMPNVKNLLKVQDLMIETDIEFVEVTVDNNKDIGYNVLDTLQISGQSSSTAATTGIKGMPTLFGVSASANARIKALVGSGQGKIVASPHISTKNGEVGTFQSGGTKYFSISGNVGGNLQSVDYGVLLHVKPVMQGRDRIMNEISIEVSMPIPDPSGVFTLDKHATTCTAICRVGESVVLSGMVQKMNNSNSSKAPVLGDVPLVSLFFSNRQSDKSRNEFVIVVTPQPVFPAVASSAPFSDVHKATLQNKDNKD